LQRVLGVIQDAALAWQTAEALWGQQANNESFRQTAASLFEFQDKASNQARKRFSKLWAKFEGKNL
jgi:hypothetical protein